MRAAGGLKRGWGWHWGLYHLHLEQGWPHLQGLPMLMLHRCLPGSCSPPPASPQPCPAVREGLRGTCDLKGVGVLLLQLCQGKVKEGAALSLFQSLGPSQELVLSSPDCSQLASLLYCLLYWHLLSGRFYLLPILAHLSSLWLIPFLAR